MSDRWVHGAFATGWLLARRAGPGRRTLLSRQLRGVRISRTGRRIQCARRLVADVGARYALPVTEQ